MEVAKVEMSMSAQGDGWGRATHLGIPRVRPAGYGKQGNDLPVLRRLISAEHARQMNSALVPYLMYLEGSLRTGQD